MAELNSLLTDFGKCARLLAHWLDDRPQLSAIEQIPLDNHLHVINLSYGAWKHQQPYDDQGPPGSMAKK